MIFTEQQFERFSKPPFKYERKQVVDTHTEIRKAIDAHFDKQAIKEKYDLAELPDLDPFLQGSMERKAHPQKNTLLQAATSNAETKACKRVFFLPPRKNYFLKFPPLQKIF